VSDVVRPASPPGLYRRVMGRVRGLYDWVLSWAEGPHGARALFVLAFAESSFFPIPPDVLLIALCVGAPKRSLWFAGVCALGSLLGGIAGYGIGMFAADLGRWLIQQAAGAGGLDLATQAFDEYGAWAVAIAAFTPLPYKVMTVASGIFHEQISLGVFVGVSALARSARFVLVAGLIRAFGAPVRGLIDRWFNVLSIAFVVLLIAGFVLLKGFLQ